jgi:hypothetical protein
MDSAKREQGTKLSAVCKRFLTEFIRAATGVACVDHAWKSCVSSITLAGAFGALTSLFRV